MALRKTAIAIPEEILDQVDRAAEERGESRSRYITRVLSVAVRARRDAAITRKLNELFSSTEAQAEQEELAEELGEAAVSWAEPGW